jgi:CMP-N-acetylneuraminic acid synthetase
MSVYAFIFARGGSKGVYQKNIREICGKPLIYYSIDLAKKIADVDNIFVSTDDPQIKRISIDYGASIIDRPKSLAQDNSPEWLSWVHAVNCIQNSGDNFDIFLSLPTTSPLRNIEDVKSAINLLDNNTDLVLSIAKAARSPWFNMVKYNEKGMLELIMKNKDVFRRQDAPKVYDLATSVYVTRPKYIKSSTGIFDGSVKGVEIPTRRAIDIDTELDFEIAELLMKKSKRL